MLMQTMVFRGIFQNLPFKDYQTENHCIPVEWNKFFTFFFQIGLKHMKIQQNDSQLSFYCYPPQLKYNGYNVFYIAF